MRFLFATFEGGGHVPPVLLVAQKLKGRGHEVLVLSDEANRPQAEAAALGFETWRAAPNRRRLAGADDPLDDWRSRWPPAVVRAVCRAVITGPARAYAADSLATMARFQPDVVVANELLFGVMAACETARTPLALLTSNVWCFPTRDDQPPFGPGFPPARNAYEAGRERASRRMIGRWYDVGLTDLNAARHDLGLPRLRATLDQLNAAKLVLIGASATFDYGAGAPPAPFAYVGPLAATPQWARVEPEAGLLDPSLPNILISFSTAHRGQEAVLSRVIRALATLPVRGIVTLGPALSAEGLPHAPNVKVVGMANHDALAPQCRLVVCHGGHGTVIRPLTFGTPVICIPTGRDQPENAARIAWAGAGLRLPRSAGVRRIRDAVLRVLEDPSFRGGAKRLGEALRRETDGGERAADLLEGLADQRRRIA